MGTRSQIALVAALALAIFLGSAFSPGLMDDADSVHAEAAREILLRGDWVTLYINGIRYLEKAPLMYWSMAAAYKLMGVWELPARLPIVLGGVALTLALYAFGFFFFDRRTAFYAGLATPTSFGIYLFTRITIPDVLLALFVTAAGFFFLAANSANDPKYEKLYYGMYVSMALAVLTKGLVGIIFPGVAIGAYLLLTRQFRWAVIRRMRLLSGTLLLLAIAAPWHILAGLRTEKFFWFYFMNEHFLRYLGKRVPPDYDKVPLLLFWGLHLVWLFPWTPFLFVYRTPALDREKRVLQFLWLWALLIIVFFSFSTRQEYYAFASYPALILIAARALAEAETRGGKALLWAHRALLAVGAIASAVLGVMVALSLRTRVEGDIANLLARNPDEYALSLGHFLDLTPQAFAALRLPAIGAAVAMLAGSWIALWLRGKGRHAGATLAVALMSAAFILCAHAALVTFSPYLGSKNLALAIRPRLQAGDRIVINGEYESGSTLNFYTGRQVYILNGRSSNLWFGSYYPDAPHIFLENADLARLWREPGRVFLFTDLEDQPKVMKVIGQAKEIARSGGKAILTNR